MSKILLLGHDNKIFFVEGSPEEICINYNQNRYKRHDLVMAVNIYLPPEARVEDNSQELKDLFYLCCAANTVNKTILKES